MKCILVDYEKIIRPFPKIVNKLSVPKKFESIGLILVLKDNVYEELNNLSLGDKRVKYITSDIFLKNIVDHDYVFYNEKKDLCFMNNDCSQYLDEVLVCFDKYLPKDTTTCVCFDLKHKNFKKVVEKFISKGFNSPIISSKHPHHKNIAPSLFLIRKNTDSNYKMTLNNLMYSLQQSNNDICSLYAKLSPKCVKFLKNTSKSGKTKNKNGEVTQKEMTGELFVNDIINERGKLVFEIDIKKDSIEHGSEENVDVYSTRYNFHSHPEEAYIRHSVNKAWPSVTDYLGYHKLGENTIFHCVTSLEGIYVISFSPYWGKRLKQIDRKFIDKNYDIDHNSDYTPYEYAKKINNILYKGEPIFHIQYFEWEKADNLIHVYYTHTGSTCLPSQDLVDSYELIFSK
jgi:hypothetical protein